MKNTVVDSLIDLLDCLLISLSSGGLVVCGKSGGILLHSGTKLGLEYLVLKGLGLDDLNALLCGLDVRQLFHLPQKEISITSLPQLRGSAEGG